MVLADKEQDTTELVKLTGLKHIAIIMDGNRRWAKEKHLPSAMGHQRGVASLKTVLKSCHSFGIEYLTVYAFSTENWNRPPEEVSFLMGLLAGTIKKEIKELNENGVRIKFIGNTEVLNSDLKKIIYDAEDKTKDNIGVKLQIAFNYGARAELVNAAKLIATEVQNGTLELNDISEQTLNDRLYTRTLPDPDLLIRTGGEQRISNYLLWQSAYSEIYVTKTYWPDFDRVSLEEAVAEYARRTRRFGK